MTVNGVQECVPYTAPFQAGQPVTVTRSCAANETWLASNTNAPPAQGQPPSAGADLLTYGKHGRIAGRR